MNWRDLPARDWPEASIPTAEQFAFWLESLTHEQLVWYVAQRQDMERKDSHCFLANHEDTIADLSHKVEHLQRKINHLEGKDSDWDGDPLLV